MKNDPVNSPYHYTQGGIETIDYLQAKLGDEGFMAFCAGNVLKYVSRYRHKNGLEDLKKAQFYLDRMIAEGETKPESSRITFCRTCGRSPRYCRCDTANEEPASE